MTDINSTTNTTKQDSNYKWYVLQVYAGSENLVINEINDLLLKKNLQDKIQEILVPTQDEIQIRRGKKIEVQKKCLPGYVLLHANLTDELIDLIKNIQKVSGFLTSGNPKPQSVSDTDLEFFIAKVHNFNKPGEKKHGKIDFHIGEEVFISDGPFLGFKGLVSEIDHEKGRLKLSVMVLSRETPVDLEVDQVKKET